MQTNNITPNLERPMLRMGSVAFLAGLVIIIISTLFHASSEDLMDNPVVFAVYAESDTWIAAHIGQFAGVMLVFSGGFVALFRLLVKSESATTSAGNSSMRIMQSGSNYLEAGWQVQQQQNSATVLVQLDGEIAEGGQRIVVMVVPFLHH
jgi:hypothetical protein